MGANVRFRSPSDYIRQKANVRAKCHCGHVGVVDAEKFKRWVDAHRYNDWLEMCGGYLNAAVQAACDQHQAGPESSDEPVVDEAGRLIGSPRKTAERITSIVRKCSGAPLKHRLANATCQVRMLDHQSTQSGRHHTRARH
jgi:hypothetical protein